MKFLDCAGVRFEENTRASLEAGEVVVIEVDKNHNEFCEEERDGRSCSIIGVLATGVS